MYSGAFRGRGGPRTSTPAHVRCQKCLERGHYSYECKTTAQERPYIKRPSRSQQLANPKLRPQLAGDTPNPLQKKEGAADAELARIEAERARGRERRAKDDELLAEGERLTRGLGRHEESDRGRKRTRSVSSESVSSYSSRSRSRSQSLSLRPSQRKKTRPAALDKSPSPVDRRRKDESRSPSRSESRSPSRSESPRSRRSAVSPPRHHDRDERQTRRSPSQSPSRLRGLSVGSHGSAVRPSSRRQLPSHSPSPSRRSHAHQRSISPDNTTRHRASKRKHRSPSPQQDRGSPPPRRPRYSRSRSPRQRPRQYQGRDRREDRRDRDERSGYKGDFRGVKGAFRSVPDRDTGLSMRDTAEDPQDRRNPRACDRSASPARKPQPEHVRERSLSPFSKRMAMTRALNKGQQ